MNSKGYESGQKSKQSARQFFGSLWPKADGHRLMQAGRKLAV